MELRDMQLMEIYQRLMSGVYGDGEHPPSFSHFIASLNIDPRTPLPTPKSGTVEFVTPFYQHPTNDRSQHYDPTENDVHELDSFGSEISMMEVQETNAAWTPNQPVPNIQNLTRVPSQRNVPDSFCRIPNGKSADGSTGSCFSCQCRQHGGQRHI